MITFIWEKIKGCKHASVRITKVTDSGSWKRADGTKASYKAEYGTCRKCKVKLYRYVYSYDKLVMGWWPVL